MKKIIFIQAIIIMFIFNTMAQNKKIAVFDPVGADEKAIIEIVREEITNYIVNAGYKVLEREQIETVLKESKYQDKGYVDNSEASRMGRQLGATSVIVTTINKMSTNYYIYCKMVDVESAEIEKMSREQTLRGTDDLFITLQKLLGKMFDQKTRSSENIKQQENFTGKNSTYSGELIAKKANVFKYDNVLMTNGGKLDKNEVRRLLANTDALKLYNNGLEKTKKGNNMVIIGSCLAGVGLVFAGCSAIFPDYYYDNYYKEHYWVGWGGFCGMFIPGALMLGAGVGTLVPGVKLIKQGNEFIERAVGMYNSNHSFSSTELRLNFTGNGIKLALTF